MLLMSHPYPILDMAHSGSHLQTVPIPTGNSCISSWGCLRGKAEGAGTLTTQDFFLTKEKWVLMDNYSGFLTPRGKILKCVSFVFYRVLRKTDPLLPCTSNPLWMHTSLTSLSSYIILPLSHSKSWDHLLNKLLASKSLCQSLLWGKPK